MYSYGRKIIIGLLIVVSVFSAFSFAKDDCDGVFVSQSWSLFDSSLPAEDLEIARNHLKAYCCVERPTLDVLSGKCEDLEAGAQSPYWYDHLVDVGFRRLDAELMYPEMTVDPQGKEWREFMKDAEKLKNADEFKKKYEKYWIQSSPYLFAEYGNDYQKFNLDRDSFLSSVAGFNLYDKYINYCFIAMMMYNGPLKGSSDIDLVSDGYYGRCLSMAKSRIRQETSLAIMASQYTSATLLNEGLTSYTKQFVQNRLMKLFDKLVSISSLFNTLAKQAPLSDICTK